MENFGWAMKNRAREWFGGNYKMAKRKETDLMF
jgi:hypothetical protein